VCRSPLHLFEVLRATISQAIPYQAMVLYECRAGRMIPEFLDGEASGQFAKLEIPLGMGLAGWVAENHKAILNGNPSVEPGYLNDPARFSTLSSALAVPVEYPDRPCGVLSVYRRDRDGFQGVELQTLQKLASRAGALELRKFVG
jgi:GAF domain-containing protein